MPESDVRSVMQCLCVSLPPAGRWHGIFNARNDLSECCAHEGGTNSDGSAQVLVS